MTAPRRPSAGYAWMSSFPQAPAAEAGIWICDVFGGLMGEVAVLAALHHRKKTGKGQFIEMSQTENIMRAMGWVWPYQQMTGKGVEPSGNRDQCICPADTFLCKDDLFVAMAAPAPDEFKGLCKAMGKVGTGRRSALQGAHQSARSGKRLGDPEDHCRLGTYENGR